MEPDRASRDGICVVAAAPSLTPWSVLRESAADEGEEEYDFYGYDETYYPRPPWVWPRGIEWLHQCSGISAALQARGFSADEAAGIMGMNFLRVLARIRGS